VCVCVCVCVCRKDVCRVVPSFYGPQIRAEALSPIVVPICQMAPSKPFSQQRIEEIRHMSEALSMGLFEWPRIDQNNQNILVSALLVQVHVWKVGRSQMPVRPCWRPHNILCKQVSHAYV